LTYRPHPAGVVQYVTYKYRYCVMRTRLGVALMVSWRAVIVNATMQSIICWYRARCISATTHWRCAGLSLCRILCHGWACGVGRSARSAVYLRSALSVPRAWAVHWFFVSSYDCPSPSSVVTVIRLAV